MDENYVPLTELGQANGVATTDNYGSITTAQIPSSAVTNRTSLYYEASSQGVVYLAADATHTVISTSNTREFRLASIYVTDPGYPWYPLAFAWVLGKSGGTDPGQGIPTPTSDNWLFNRHKVFRTASMLRLFVYPA